MSDIEIWMDFPDYEGYYKVSSLGRIKSPEKKDAKGVIRKERIIKGAKNNEGYWRLRLWKDGVSISTSVHRMVALTFLENPENKPRVNHKDNNPSNNNVLNLEWATHQEDIDHKCRQGRQNKWQSIPHPNLGKTGDRHSNFGKHYNIGKDSSFARLVLDMQTGIFYDCVKEAAEAKNMNPGTLYNRLSGRRKNNTGLILADEKSINRNVQEQCLGQV